MLTPFSGGCLCGAVRYECSAAPLFVAQCHWVTTICLVGLLIGDVRAQPTPDKPSLRFGIMVASQSSWGKIQSLWQAIEELGFDSAWVYDHLLIPDDEATPWQPKSLSRNSAAVAVAMGCPICAVILRRE